METLRNLKAMHEKSGLLRASGKTIGYVPTMGALHEGHLSLVKKSKTQNDTTVASIFVNPIQFGPHEDYLSYPKSLEQDLALLESAGCEFVFVPEARDMFPPGFQTRVEVEHLSKPLCGPFRPGHFRGVATVVLKLFHIVNPHRAYFGEKDYQQLQIVKQMARDLFLDIEIVPCPTVREPDGLAMSSRNRYLSPEERKAAAVLFAALSAGRETIRGGETNPESVIRVVAGVLEKEPLVKVEYISVADPETLLPLESSGKKSLLALAVRVGNARLIDNVIVD